jgi:hypothetical protein
MKLHSHSVNANFKTQNDEFYLLKSHSIGILLENSYFNF